MHSLIFRSHGTENRIKSGRLLLRIGSCNHLDFFTVSFDLQNVCTVAKVSLLEFVLLNYHIIYILGKIWARMLAGLRSSQQNRTP